jgi:NADH-quinone oxidoreductase subunit A
MTSPVDAHVPLLLTFFMAAGLGTIILSLSAFLGPRRPSAIKSDVFECGNESSGPALDRFNVKFYLVAILFLVFDIESVFIYPWALVFHDAALGLPGGPEPLMALGEMLVFVSIILVGLTYAWRKGALDWGQRPSSMSPTPTTAHHPAHGGHA